VPTKTIPVVVETPQGARSKVEYDYQIGCLKLTKVLPAGFTFPLNFGSIPGTLADDGDPLDILLFMTDPVPSGTLVEARPIGVMEAEQKEEDGKKERNDRLFGVAVHSTEHRHVGSVSDVEKQTRKELERFFQDYNEEEGKEFRCLGWFGPKRAWRLIDRGRRKFRPLKRAGRLPKSFPGFVKALDAD
jgi:inorganic pyrophosphatase